MADRIVLFAKGFPPTIGGVETYSEQVARAYIRAGYDVIVVTQSAGGRGFSERDTSDGRFNMWNVGPGSQLWVFLRMIAIAIELRRKRNIAAVHSTTWRVGIVAQLIFYRTVRVVTVHGREVLNFPPGAGAVMRYVLRRATAILAVSSETLRLAKRAARATPSDSRWMVSFNGLTDASRALLSQPRTSKEVVNVLSLCRLVPRKNIANVVKALSLCAPSVADRLFLRIAGRGPETSSVQSAITTNHLSSRVSMLGYVAEEDVPNLYEWADIFIHPHSHDDSAEFEGFGIAIADAMAYGCAVISGRDGGPLDYIVDGSSGLLVNGDDPVDIARALTQLTTDASLRRQVAASGRDTALAHFSWDLHIRPTMTLIEKADGE